MRIARSFGQNAGRFCELVGVEVPIIQAPMAGGWTTPELAASVANAGGLGMLAAALQTAEQLEAQVQTVRQLSPRPVGVNFLIAPPDPFDGNAALVQKALNELRSELNIAHRGDAIGRTLPPPPLEEQLEMVLDSDLPVVSFAMGDPARFVDRVHGAGKLVLGTATTVEEAMTLEEGGVDMIVVQGAEAGGHRSTFARTEPSFDDLPLVGAMVLIPSVVDAVQCPVIASGGIMDGRGLVAALALGASGVQMGTRFLLSEESGAPAPYKQRIFDAREDDTEITWHLTGRPARSIRNRYLDHLKDADVRPLPWPYQAVAAEDIYQTAVVNSMDAFMPLLAGQGSRLAESELRASDVLQRISDEAERLIRELGADVKRERPTTA